MKIKLVITADALGKEVTVFEDKPELTSRELDLLIIAIQKTLNKLLVAQVNEDA
jgi:hypothetical protein